MMSEGSLDPLSLVGQNECSEEEFEICHFWRLSWVDVEESGWNNYNLKFNGKPQVKS